jgi:hypothetical protein
VQHLCFSVFFSFEMTWSVWGEPTGAGPRSAWRRRRASPTLRPITLSGILLSGILLSRRCKWPALPCFATRGYIERRVVRARAGRLLQSRWKTHKKSWGSLGKVGVHYAIWREIASLVERPSFSSQLWGVCTYVGTHDDGTRTRQNKHLHCRSLAHPSEHMHVWAQQCSEIWTCMHWCTAVSASQSVQA